MVNVPKELNIWFPFTLVIHLHAYNIIVKCNKNVKVKGLHVAVNAAVSLPHCWTFRQT